MNKFKIINDPVYGFINIPTTLVYDLISHPYFQRLRRIKQMGLADLVYPGATHSRFHHALGAMHLMQEALDVLRSKGHDISAEEEEGAIMAILLHDIGHGPFSHTLEYSLISGVHHEELSELLQASLNRQYQGRLSLAIDIFNGTYHKHFLHQLVSGQLDADRMDYLNRDSFYTGVAEGVIGYDRIIKMLDIHDGRLVVEEKGIYSIEKFIVSRRLMYWQVYLHKTSIAADHMLISIIQRAKFLLKEGEEVAGGSPALMHFLKHHLSIDDFVANPIHLQQFAELDDTDVQHAIKIWQQHPDPILSFLSRSLLNRQLFKIKYCEADIAHELLTNMKAEFLAQHIEMQGLDEYLFFEGSANNNAYIPGRDSIQIKMKSGEVKDIAEVAEVLTIKALSNPVVKHYICYPQI
jgi:uncharacterized protein